MCVCTRYTATHSQHASHRCVQSTYFYIESVSAFAILHEYRLHNCVRARSYRINGYPVGIFVFMSFQRRYVRVHMYVCMYIRIHTYLPRGRKISERNERKETVLLSTRDLRNTPTHTERTVTANPPIELSLKVCLWRRSTDGLSLAEL